MSTGATPRRWARVLTALLLAGVAAGALGWALVVRPRTPQGEARWARDHARLARATFEGDSAVTVRDIRDFTYTSSVDFTPAYRDQRYDLAHVASVWFVLTPFSESWRGPAHAFVSFGFDDGAYLSISVEARREAGEEYALIAGALRRFELAYIVGTERDLIGRRALFDDDNVYVYPMRAPRERVRQMFVEMLQRANAVQERPEFYNTFTNNCTSNLVDHVNHMVPGRIPSSVRTLLPGYADELARSLDLIDASGSVAELRERVRVNARVRALRPGEDLSAAIRRGIAPGGDAHRP